MNKQIVLDTVYSVVEGVGHLEGEAFLEQGEESLRDDSSLDGSLAWADKGLFVVNVACKGVSGDEIEVLLDCDGVIVDSESGVQSISGVRVDDCVAISREISGQLHTILDVIGADGEVEKEADFSLTVMSSGLGSPLKLGRQYRKLMIKASLTDGIDACRVDVLFKDGRKLTGVYLCGLGYNASESKEGEDMPNGIEVFYEVKELVEGRKRKELVERREQIELKDVKAVTEFFEFK